MIKLFILFTILSFIFAQDVCTHKLMQECETDGTKAYEACDKAAKQKGADQTADINCLKYLLSARKQCWACICQMAKQQGWKVKGCKLMEFINDSVKIIKNIKTN